MDVDYIADIVRSMVYSFHSREDKIMEDLNEGDSVVQTLAGTNARLLKVEIIHLFPTLLATLMVRSTLLICN